MSFMDNLFLSVRQWLLLHELSDMGLDGIVHKCILHHDAGINKGRMIGGKLRIILLRMGFQLAALPREGLVVDKGITMGDLKGVLELFAKKVFGENTKIRFRPHHFPFTEPSAEVDVSCWECGGKGCRVCKGEGWVEILGAGMVHPFVLKNCGIDPDVYSGFAFGMGIERIALSRFGIDDLRLFYENDERFLKQF